MYISIAVMCYIARLWPYEIVMTSVLVMQLWPCTSYQLAQSVFKIGFVLAKKWDRGRWAGVLCT